MRTDLPPQKKQYKANLHCHSKVYGEHFTPEQHKKNYQAAGYVILAYGGHNLCGVQDSPYNDSFGGFNMICMDRLTV